MPRSQLTKNFLMTWPRNAILLNGAVQNATQEIGVPSRVARVVRLTPLALDDSMMVSASALI